MSQLAPPPKQRAIQALAGIVAMSMGAAFVDWRAGLGVLGLALLVTSGIGRS